MGEKVILTHEGAEQFENALNMLDSSLNELRKVADNMLPQKLVNEGLKIYLPEFCRFIELERNITVNLSFNSEFNRVEESSESAIFRIVKSLVGYILKYSEASMINISISLENHMLTLQVFNNGKGFDLSSPTVLGSKEIAHIKLWVEIIKGRFLIIPEPNKGNEVIVEFDIN
jgi:signal transduction histidine kinase